MFRLREDAPGRREYQRGGLPDLDAEDARLQALEQFDTDVLATTTRSAEKSRTATLHRLMLPWGVPLLPLRVRRYELWVPP